MLTFSDKMNDTVNFLDVIVAILRGALFFYFLRTAMNLTFLHSPLLLQCFKVVQNN